MCRGGEERRARSEAPYVAKPVPVSNVHAVASLVAGSCADYVLYSQEVSALKSARSTLETKLDVCTRCSAVGLDGVAGATIPYVDQHGEAGHAECDSYLAVESTERRKLFLGKLWSNSDYGEWSKPISAYKVRVRGEGGAKSEATMCCVYRGVTWGA